MNYSELKQHLIPFVDAISLDEAKGILEDQILAGFPHILKKNAAYLDDFIVSNPDKALLREFVAYEMNLDFSDPSGEADFQWLISARDTIKAALSEAGY